MSNGPNADIEILYLPPPSLRLHNQRRHKQTKSDNDKSKFVLRINFSQQRKVIEVVQFDASSTTNGGQWTKKMFYGADADSPFKNLSLWAPELLQRDVGRDLQQFAFKCKSIENTLDSAFVSDITILDLEPVGVSASIGAQHPSRSSSNLRSRPITKYSDPLHTGSSTGGFQTADTSRESYSFQGTKASSVPSKPTPVDSRKWHSLHSESIGSSAPKTTSERHSRAMPSDDSFSKESTEVGPHPQTRFIPSVGWCIRYGSKMSQGGRYQIMFIDGVCLNVDVDEEKVEYTNTSGKTTR